MLRPERPFVDGRDGMVIEQVECVNLENEAAVFVPAIEPDLMTDIGIGLVVGRGATPLNHAVFDQIPGGGIAVNFYEITAPFSPLAGGVRIPDSENAQAGAGGRTLVKSLCSSKRRFLSEPSPSVGAEEFPGVWTIGPERAIIRLPTGKIGHCWYVERAPIVGGVPSAAAIGDVRIGETGVIAAESGVGVAGGTPPV